ncbi:PASTA domain-containing protein [Yinghuangia soli]|uniref:PASTA domain-containing protein n=1 Tax=Yinghuangia soli TaxID=2908204 RepID=A0AA41TXM6_9ACTN|nr:PASTA domain-containing protein [Yinghuangia soli]MCF2526993.1 PASTA domain-containing protein [Yinghuangia soli]
MQAWCDPVRVQVSPGEQVRFRVMLRNAGPRPSLFTIEALDDPDRRLALETVPGVLAPNQSAAVQVRYTVPGGDSLTDALFQAGGRAGIPGADQAGDIAGALPSAPLLVPIRVVSSADRRIAAGTTFAVDVRGGHERPELRDRNAAHHQGGYSGGGTSSGASAGAAGKIAAVMLLVVGIVAAAWFGVASAGSGGGGAGGGDQGLAGTPGASDSASPGAGTSPGTASPLRTGPSGASQLPGGNVTKPGSPTISGGGTTTRPGGPATSPAAGVTTTAAPVAKVAVPALDRKTLTDGQSALTTAQLKATIVTVTNVGAAKDVIVGSSPGAGTQVDRGSAVVIRVSDGRIKVPDVVGMQSGPALTELTNAGFTLVRKCNMVGTTGEVMSTGYPAGTDLAYGTTMAVTYDGPCT